MMEHEEALESINFKDRKTGLVVFGILEVIFGVFCALLVPLMIIGMMLSSSLGEDPPGSPSVGMILPSVLVYVILAVWFIWMGIGSIKARRWARALLLVSSWVWLVAGIIALVFMFVFMPDMSAQMSNNGQVSQEMATIIGNVMQVFLVIIYVVIPGALILFYGSKNVKQTCETRDPHTRWTDKCPLPVLAVALMLGFGVVSMLSIGFYGWAIPFFGIVLSGATGAIVVLISMLITAYVSWGMYKLKITAWWTSVILATTWALSSVITFSRVSMLDYYKKMDLPEQQLDMMMQYQMFDGATMAIMVGVWFIGFLGYLIYIKRYFAE